MSEKYLGKRQRALMDEASRYRERASADANDDVFSRWECMRGHHWDDALDASQNVRCMNCATQRREAETNRARMIAQARGGALLQSGDATATSSLTWQCAFGHTWKANADSAQRRWCDECARTVFARYR
ncbi:hypothetical protein P9239_15650 [Caballeronia sp. LZ062]|uniref:hypothetical protein n=1 Tax=unclassified Caballeronia TaxID=2646786 RepID=UPI002861164B|nr:MULTISPECIES: hypothetical protein [unclassified Caballeronia]MDR5853690.1 hypothetical protein [Caballeronia sp. LZ050]MDR5871777.1 hypothetical protein [Caballeronia sp. LZ062]